MTKIVTKVKNKARGAEEISVEKVLGWGAVLVDIRIQIQRLQNLVPIIERKIERGEPWPTEQSTDHSREQRHSV
jgi:hypothetical protein